MNTRPTVAAMRALEAERDEAMRQSARLTQALASANANVDHARQQRDAIDAEALALAGCIAALDELTTDRGRRLTSWSNEGPFGSPAGRVLLHLAARYAVAIGPIPQPEVTVEHAGLAAELEALAYRLRSVEA